MPSRRTNYTVIALRSDCDLAHAGADWLFTPEDAEFTLQADGAREEEEEEGEEAGRPRRAPPVLCATAAAFGVVA